MNDNTAPREARLRVEFALSDDTLLRDLFGHAEPQWGDESQPFEGLKVRFKSGNERGLDGLRFVEIILVLTAGLSRDLLTNYLYDILKERASKTRINSKPVEVNKNEIKQALEPITEAEESAKENA